MSQFIRKSIESVLTSERHAELRQLFKDVPTLANALEMGGWICGGFPRHLLLGRSVTEYFSPELNERPGDVDIFFKSVDDANRAAAFKSDFFETPPNNSWGGFALETFGRSARVSVQVQFVNHPDKVYQSVETTLENFDFLNCMVAITSEGFLIAEGWRETEDAKLLKICNNISPFLGSRILKYLTKRGLDNISADSQELLSAWFCSASNADFANSEKKHLAGLQYAVKSLDALNHLRREDLLFFIGKYQEMVKETAYGETKTFDWALRRIGKSTADNITNI